LIERIVQAQQRDLGDGFVVARALPSPNLRNVGPFVFFDQMGPTVLRPGQGLDVRPHPHIGLATVTYLFAGEILHRDSLGSVQPIRPAAVNWMTAGSGIVHSERTAPETRKTGGALFGIQAWVALPIEHEEAAPDFTHHPAADLPVLQADGATVRLIVGSLFGKRSPVRAYSDVTYADAMLSSGSRINFEDGHEERGVYVAEGRVSLAGQSVEAGQLAVCRPGEAVTVDASQPARVMLLGGAALDAPRTVWWNFVSSSRERIERAKDDWKAGRFARVPGETEFIPLPDTPMPKPVDYP
jgi:redox-sensitive bicupin YhaK (pirin superfamily)